ncbi:hypothetical protein [Aliagarivorans taiwanensis]|uniref:hypothetical protein n=1 Tax=Aliagarivorans taiwanensis TaxID=561966 RepID=UPI000413C2A4|nr:hypothetical protein [Aliagarivorans taiwanensis]
MSDNDHELLQLAATLQGAVTKAGGKPQQEEPGRRVSDRPSRTVSPYANLELGIARPFTGADIVRELNTRGIAAQKFISFLGINMNRWSNLTKVSNDGRDMSVDFVPPTIEILFRLLLAFPKYAPWDQPTPLDIMTKASMDPRELAFTVGLSGAAGENWRPSPNNTARSKKVATAVEVLLSVMDKMLDDNHTSELFENVARHVYTLRERAESSNDPVIRSVWVTPSEQAFRRVRKELRSTILQLHRGKSSRSLTRSRCDTIMMNLVVDSDEKNQTLFNDWQKDSGLADVELKAAIEVTQQCVAWLKLRNKVQKALFDKLQHEELAGKGLDIESAAYVALKGAHSSLEAELTNATEALTQLTGVVFYSQQVDEAEEHE